MSTFGSCHLIINRLITNGCDFKDADFFKGEVLLIHFLNGLHSQTPTFLLLLRSFWENVKCFYR